MDIKAEEKEKYLATLELLLIFLEDGNIELCKEYLKEHLKRRQNNEHSKSKSR